MYFPAFKEPGIPAKCNLGKNHYTFTTYLAVPGYNFTFTPPHFLSCEFYTVGVIYRYSSGKRLESPTNSILAAVPWKITALQTYVSPIISNVCLDVKRLLAAVNWLVIFQSFQNY